MNVAFSAGKLLPEPPEVLAALSVPPGARVSPSARDLVGEALTHLAGAAEPVGIMEPVSREDFETLLVQDLGHADDALVARIHPRAHALALFAATLGAGVGREIRDLAGRGRHALAACLDAGASRMTEKVPQALAARMRDGLPDRGEARSPRVLAYGPGCCGWPLTGQRALLVRLGPEEIGITCTEECFMRPLKSVAGVLAAAPEAVHRVESGLPCCQGCPGDPCATRWRQA